MTPREVIRDARFGYAFHPGAGYDPNGSLALQCAWCTTMNMAWAGFSVYYRGWQPRFICDKCLDTEIDATSEAVAASMWLVLWDGAW